MKDEVSAYAYYQQLVQQHPQSDMSRAAKKRLAVLPKPRVSPVKTAVTAVAEPQGAAPKLENIRYWSGPEYTRVVLDLNAPVLAEPHLLKGDNPRLYFDLVYTEVAAKLQSEIAIHNGLVRRVRASQFDRQKVRVVVDLYQASEYRLVSLDNPYRIVIDILGRANQGTEKNRQPVVRSKPHTADDSIASILNNVSISQPTLHVPQQRKDEGVAPDCRRCRSWRKRSWCGWST